jgi:hypothetical protein
MSIMQSVVRLVDSFYRKTSTMTFFIFYFKHSLDRYRYVFETNLRNVPDIYAAQRFYMESNILSNVPKKAQTKGIRKTLLIKTICLLALVVISTHALFSDWYVTLCESCVIDLQCFINK